MISSKRPDSLFGVEDFLPDDPQRVKLLRAIDGGATSAGALRRAVGGPDRGSFEKMLRGAYADGLIEFGGNQVNLTDLGSRATRKR
ncbi:MAG: hypothetical protein AAF192_07840 [Pseudomonadota bacterium]